MGKKKRLANAEGEIMEGVWEFEGEVTVRGVHERLYPDGQKAYTTVQTVMNILVEKGYLKKKKVGMVNFYTPAVSRVEAAQQETRSLVSRLYRGSFGALAAHLVDSGALSKKELDELKALIDAKERGQTPGGA